MPPLMPVDEALSRVLAAFSPLECETVPLRDALGRVLGEPAVAQSTNPPFSASAMDGYAVRAADLAGRRPITLKPIGEASAGHAYEGEVGDGECVRIFTGAPLPDGADSVVIQENVSLNADENVIQVVSDDPVPEGRFVRPAGHDFRQGEHLLEPGTRIGPQEMALLGAADSASLILRRRPRVALISNGDELVEPGAPRETGQVPASNAIALKALIEAYGGHADDLGIARDSIDSLQEVAKRALGYDLMVTIGGASVGDRDLVQAALAPMGFDVDFWRVAMRPGKPLIFGRLSETPLLGLPGNPVSSLVCGFLFVLPAIRAMLGMPSPAPARLYARLAEPLGKNGPRQAYLRATLGVDSDGTLLAVPLAEQDSGYLRPLATADGLVIRPPHAPPAGTGEIVEIHVLRGLGGRL